MKTAVNQATSVTLKWNANPETESVTSYNVYERNPDGTYVALESVPAAPEPEFTVANLTPGAHTFAVTAVNMNAESDRSNDATLPAPPTPPTGLRIEITVNINT